MVEEWCQTVTPSPAALIISMTITEGPAALPGFVLLVALDTISGAALIASHSAGASSLIFPEFHENSTFKSF